MARSTLTLGEHVVLVADGGTPEAEYLLFEPGDIELFASEPGIIREVGFGTTVATARARLAGFGFTLELGRDAAHAAGAVALAYARGPAVRRVARLLDAAELFEGATFDAEASQYAGFWLEMGALADDLQLPPPARASLQALHLAGLLAEHDDDEPLLLSTAEVTAQRRAGERTYRRPRFSDPRDLVRALGSARPGLRRCESGPGPQAILDHVQARPRRTPAARERAKAIEAALAMREAPGSGPLADPELWEVELALCDGEVRRGLALLETLEQRRGRIPATAYLRARAALMTGSEAPAAVAERVSALSTSMSHFHELQLLSAQAWAAAGEAKRAAAFARDLVDNASAPDAVRMRAQDLLGGPPSSRHPVPARASVRPAAAEAAPRASTRPPLPSRPPVRGDGPATHFGVEPHSARAWSLPPQAPATSEPLERLGLPGSGLDADAAHSAPETPRTPVEARVHCTLLARDLGRSLREHYGVDAQCDLDGLEIAQRHLRESLPDAGARPLRPEELRQLARHGALLSELLARRLGGRWVDLGSDPQRWAMVVPSASRAESTRVWPFARTTRFALMGHKERDLVSYYLEVEARTRGT